MKYRPTPQQVVRQQYPEAIAIPWWSGLRAWIVIPFNRAANAFDLGGGETERRAWQAAARRIDSGVKAKP